MVSIFYLFLGKHPCTEGDCAPSDKVVNPSLSLKDWSTTADDPRELGTQVLGYPEAGDISSVSSDTIGVASYLGDPMVLFSPLKPFFQLVT